MREDAPFPIVGLGASAGGLEAFESFFRATPEDSGLAFVIASHLAPGRISLLVEILARYTRMPVERAADGQRIERDHIYVIQPDTVLTVVDGMLHVQQLPPPQRERNPIDILFSSIAEARGERGMGVVLSGGGADGALGIRAIKERGGLTLAQGVDGGAGPRHGGMPSAAIATGLVDLVIAAEEMPARLIAYAASLDGPQDASFERLQALEEEQFAETRDAIYAALRKQVGHDFTGYKTATFMRRVRRRMQVLQLASLEAYTERLGEQPTEVGLLFRDLLIGVTSFFRDEDAFEALERKAVPQLFGGKGASDVVRVWVPGCSTGEEVYSIAILMRERMAQMDAPPRVQIFATDIDEGALAVARGGRYPTALLEAVSPERLSRFFANESGSHVVSKHLRDLCVFSSHSLIRDPPFSRIDLVSCRNLLIYLNGALQDRLLPVFHYALKPKGFLFLGNSENVTQHAELFTPVDRKNRLFQRRDRRTVRLDYPEPPPGFAPSAMAAAVNRRGAAGSNVSLRRAVDLRVLERFAPVHVVVNGAGEVLHYSARTGKYLEPAPGEPSQRLLNMARKGLRLDLRAALQEARETRRMAVRERVGVEIDDRVQLTTLTVEPFAEATDEPLFLVLFSEVGPPLAPEQAALYGRPPDEGDAALLRLEGELRDARERLQSIIEEYETSMEELKSANEELVSVNEEIQSTNEELETSKEEIQSINEELQTVNGELNAKVEELDRANADLRNLFDSTRIATIFLDRKMTIRNFTPTVSTLFNLIASDRGRPLTDISHRLVDVDLPGDVAQSLRSGKTIERPVGLANGDARYLMRVAPYRGVGDAVDGAVLTFVDVTGLAQAEERQRIMIAELNHRVRNMLAVVMGVAANTLQGGRSASEAGEVFLGRLNAMAHAHTLVSREQWQAVPLRDLLEAELTPFLLDGKERMRLDGPDVLLGPKAAVALGMAAHELGANAVKYGALSKPDGRVEAAWRTEGDRLVVQWREVDGPPVKPPGDDGFGTALIERQIEYELDGEVEMAYLPDGLRVRIAVPLGRLHGESAPG